MTTSACSALALSLCLGLAVHAGTPPQLESPITDLDPHYLCEISNGKGSEQVAFRIPDWQFAPRLWLTIQDPDMGLEVQVANFTFLACPFCFKIEGAYVFSGAGNRVQLETEPLAIAFKPATMIAPDSDLPPGSEPPADEDLPPGSGGGADDDLPPGSEPPVTDPGEHPPPGGQLPFSGPDLKFKYRELSKTSQRVVFEGQGACKAFSSPVAFGR